MNYFPESLKYKTVKLIATSIDASIKEYIFEKNPNSDYYINLENERLDRLKQQYPEYFL